MCIGIYQRTRITHWPVQYLYWGSFNLSMHMSLNIYKQYNNIYCPKISNVFVWVFKMWRNTRFLNFLTMFLSKYNLNMFTYCYNSWIIYTFVCILEILIYWYPMATHSKTPEVIVHLNLSAVFNISLMAQCFLVNRS